MEEGSIHQGVPLARHMARPSDTRGGGASSATTPDEVPTLPPIPVPSSPNRNADNVLPRARELIRQINAAQSGPDPQWLHELAGLLEEEERRYQEHMGHPFTNTRSSYTIGRLINLARDDDDFFELVSIRLLVEPNHPTSLRAAAARLTLACSSVWLFPFILDDSVLEKLLEWTKEEQPEDEERFLAVSSRPGAKWGKDAEKRDKELLRTYATGLLAVALQNEEIVDDVVRQGLVEPLVKYLRRSVLRNEGKAGAKLVGQGLSKAGAQPGLFSSGGKEGSSRKRAKTSIGRDEGRVGSEIRMGNEGALEAVENRGITEGAKGIEAKAEGRGKGKIEETEDDMGGDSDEALDEFYHRQGIEGENAADDEGVEVGRGGPKASKAERRKSKALKAGNKRRAVAEEGGSGDGPNSLTNAEQRDEQTVPERKRRKSRKGVDPGGEKPQEGGQKSEVFAGGEGAADGSSSRVGEPLGTWVSTGVGPLVQPGHGKLEGETRYDLAIDRAGATALKLAHDRGIGTVEVADVDEFGEPKALAESRDQKAGMQKTEAEEQGAEARKLEVDAKKPGRESKRQESKAKKQGLGVSGGEALQQEGKESTGTELNPNSTETHQPQQGVADTGSVKKDKANEQKKEVDLRFVMARAREAAESEARAAGAPEEAVMAAGDAAAESVKVASADALAAGKSPEEAQAAAIAAADAVEDAAKQAASAKLLQEEQKEKKKRKDPEDLRVSEEEEVALPLGVDGSNLRRLRERYCIQCLASMGEYLEALGPVLRERGVDICLTLLKRRSDGPVSALEASDIADVLKLVCSLLAHRQFALLFVDRGGVNTFLQVVRTPHTYTGLSLCLFALASIQAVMERVCSLPGDEVSGCMELALTLIGCTHDPARKNAALFLGSALVFKAVIDAFDAQEGLKRLLSLLRAATALRADMTTSGRQIAFHTCLAIRQYLRSHLALLVDSLRQSLKGGAQMAGKETGGKRSYRPIDVSDGACDLLALAVQRDRRLGPLFVKARWPALELFLDLGGPGVMLELAKARPQIQSGERYFSDTAHAALDILSIATLAPYSHRAVVSAQLTSDEARTGMSVILDAAGGQAFSDPEIISAALEVLVHVVCPPPALSKPPTHATGGDATPGPNRGLVGDLRISLGTGGGGAGLASLMEQGFKQAREAVRQHNGIKVLLSLLHPRTALPPPTADVVRALACQALLGLARDPAIAHILTKLQIGRMLSELVRDYESLAPQPRSRPSSHPTVRNAARPDSTPAPEPIMTSSALRWPKEFKKAALDLIALTSAGGSTRGASAAAASEAAAPTMRRIERAAIAAATPISYPPRELLQVIHEHLKACGLDKAASALQTEASLPPAPKMDVEGALERGPRSSAAEPKAWPAGHTPSGFLLESAHPESKEGGPALGIATRAGGTLSRRALLVAADVRRLSPEENALSPSDTDGFVSPYRTPLVLSKRKASEPLSPPRKRLNTGESRLGENSRRAMSPDPESKPQVYKTPTAVCPNPLPEQSAINPYYWQYANSTPNRTISIPPITDAQYLASGLKGEPSNGESETTVTSTLDSIVTQYLKQQHRLCPAPITTLPPLSLHYNHVCPEPRRPLDAPANTSARLLARQWSPKFGGTGGRRQEKHLVYSRFRPWRTCRDEESTIMTSAAFLPSGGVTSRIAVGSHVGEIRIFDAGSGNMIENYAGHEENAVNLLQTVVKPGGEGAWLLSSTRREIKLWDVDNLDMGCVKTFEGCRSGRFNHAGSRIVAVEQRQSGPPQVRLYDVNSGNLELTLTDSQAGSLPGHGSRWGLGGHSNAYFSPDDSLILWGGVLWDHRLPKGIHRFDQFTDYGGGAFHPAGNEVIINSEVWDLRTFKLLRSVASLDNTTITFSRTGDIIYAILRRSSDELNAALNPKRQRHPLWSAFRTLDASDYTDIATVPVDRCVLDLAADLTDSYVGVVAIDGQGIESNVKVYEVGRRRPDEGDSDADASEEDDDDSEEDDESGGEEDASEAEDDDIENDDDEANEILRRMDEDDEDEERGDDVSSSRDESDDDEEAAMLDAMDDVDTDDVSEAEGSDDGGSYDSEERDSSEDGYETDEDYGEGGFDDLLQGML